MTAESGSEGGLAIGCGVCFAVGDASAGSGFALTAGLQEVNRKASPPNTRQNEDRRERGDMVYSGKGLLRKLKNSQIIDICHHLILGE